MFYAINALLTKRKRALGSQLHTSIGRTAVYIVMSVQTVSNLHMQKKKKKKKQKKKKKKQKKKKKKKKKELLGKSAIYAVSIYPMMMPVH